MLHLYVIQLNETELNSTERLVGQTGSGCHILAFEEHCDN